MNLSRNQKRKQTQRPVNVPGTEELQELLSREIASLPFSLPEGSTARFVQFVQLLHKWNSTYNLTSVRDMRQMLARHIMDSVVVHPYLQGNQVLDVGCGAGLPGIPLAIINPDMHFTLLDSNSKKTRFVQQAMTELQLGNITVVTERIEYYRPENAFDTIVARAYSAIDNLVAGIQHCVSAHSIILAMKGTYPVAELDTIPQGYHLDKVEPLQVPGMEAERHLVILKPDS